MSRHQLDTVSLHSTTMDAAVVMRCLLTGGHDRGVTMTGPDSGGPYVEARMQATRAERLDYSTTALETLLGAVGILDGLCLDSDGSHPGFDLFFQKNVPCGVEGRATGAAHRRTRAGNARLFITGLDCQAGGDVNVSVMVAALSTDGDAVPTLTVHNATLPSTYVADEFFTLIAPTLGGVTLEADAVKRIALDTGIRGEIRIPAGGQYGTVYVVTKTAPTWRITTEETSILGDAGVPEGGLACAHNNTVFSFRKRDPDDALFPLDEEEHIKITAAGKAYVDNSASASGSEIAEATIVLECTGDNGSPPLVASTDQALA